MGPAGQSWMSPHDAAEPGDSALRSAESEKIVSLQAPVAIVATDMKGQNSISIEPIRPQPIHLLFPSSYLPNHTSSDPAFFLYGDGHSLNSIFEFCVCDLDECLHVLMYSVYPHVLVNTCLYVVWICGSQGLKPKA